MKIKSFMEQEFNEIRESLDSFVPFIKEYSEDNYKFYEFIINDKEFRLVIETVDDESAIIFEQKINGVFIYEGIQNNLSKQESLALFSTLKNGVNLVNTYKNYIYTDSKKKLKLYLKILKTMPEVKSINYIDDNIPYVIGFGHKENLETKKTFKFKFWK